MGEFVDGWLLAELKRLLLSTTKKEFYLSCIKTFVTTCKWAEKSINWKGKPYWGFALSSFNAKIKTNHSPLLEITYYWDIMVIVFALSDSSLISYLHLHSFLIASDFLRLDSNIESKSLNNTYLNIIEIFFFPVLITLKSKI